MFALAALATSNLMQYVEVVRVYHRADDDDDGVVADEGLVEDYEEVLVDSLLRLLPLIKGGENKRDCLLIIDHF